VEELQPLPKKKPKYKRYWFIINHESRYKLLWDVVWSFMLISSYFITFFTLAFNNYPVQYNRPIEIFLDIMQIFDICLSFVTTCEGVNGGLKERPLEITIEYLKSTFIFDALGCLPNLVYRETNPEIYALKVFRFIQMSRCLDQLDYIVNKIKAKYLQYMFLITNTFSTIKLVGTLCVLFHFFACCWIYIGQFKYFEAEGWRAGVDVTDSSKWIGTYV
jgi:hypothetical protein